MEYDTTKYFGDKRLQIFEYDNQHKDERSLISHQKLLEKEFETTRHLRDERVQIPYERPSGKEYDPPRRLSDERSHISYDKHLGKEYDTAGHYNDMRSPGHYNDMRSPVPFDMKPRERYETAQDFVGTRLPRNMSNTLHLDAESLQIGGIRRSLSDEDNLTNVAKKLKEDFSSPALSQQNIPPFSDLTTWNQESYQPMSNFQATNYGNQNYNLPETYRANQHVSSAIVGFPPPSMQRFGNINHYVHIDQVNIIANSNPLLMTPSPMVDRNQPLLMIPSSMADRPVRNNITPFIESFDDQTQSKTSYLDPRVSRGDRLQAGAYDVTGQDFGQAQNNAVQDMDICEIDNVSKIDNLCKIDMDVCEIDNLTKIISYVASLNKRAGVNLGQTSTSIPHSGKALSYSPQPECSFMNSSTSKAINQPSTILLTPKDSFSDVNENNSNSISSSLDSSELKTGITQESVLQHILSWNVSWLQEQKNSSRPPPVVMGDSKKLQLTYFSFEEYFSSFLSLVLLETWQLLYTSWCHTKNDALPFIITNSRDDGGALILNCQTITPHIDAPNFPKEGKLVSFGIELKSGKTTKIFGYIVNHSVMRVELSGVSDELKRFLPAAPTVEPLVAKFSLKIKKKEVNLICNKLIQGSAIFYLKPQLHLIMSLLELPKSPLLKAILIPKKQNCEIIIPKEERILGLVGTFDTTQQSIIIGICKDITTKAEEPRIMTVQGPPGTGKTHIILGVVQQLLTSANNRILLTASTDSAMNEIAMRLKFVYESLHKSMNGDFILLGNPEKFSKELLPFTLREVSKKIGSDCKKKIKRLEADEKDIALEIDAFERSVADMKERSCPMRDIKITELELHNKFKQQIAIRDKIKSATAEFKEFVKREKTLVRTQLLKNATLVLSTLNNSRQLLLDGQLAKSYSFTCCIVDEATQCVEPEILQALIYGMNKLILFGDKCLPPIVQSKISVDKGYEISLPDRIHSSFVELDESSPVISLTEQYRMDAEISLYPEKYFYNCSYTTSSSMIKYSSFPLRPYVVLNTKSLSDKFKESGSPCLEEILVKLCKELMRVLHQRYSVGIILPSQDQLRNTQKILARHIDSKSIEVNVVDCFQNQEKDVVLLPCSGSSGENLGKSFLVHKNKLAIALTRAKKCLIIFGNFYTMTLDQNMEDLINDAKNRGLSYDLDSLDNFSHFVLKVT